MPLAMLCSEGPLTELTETVLGRPDVDRRFARTLDEVKRIARDARPDLAVIDGAFAGARDVVRGLRRYPRQVSIVVIARDPAAGSRLELMEAGANAVLAPPPTPEWDEVLSRLLAVPPRKHTRVPVYFETELRLPDRPRVGLGTILNLSIRGALIETEHPLRNGEPLEVRFRLPAPAAGVQAVARVRRLDAARRFGVEFERLEGSGRDAVSGFVADHRTEMMDPVRTRPST
jgi:hypothetical protein